MELFFNILIIVLASIAVLGGIATLVLFIIEKVLNKKAKKEQSQIELSQNDYVEQKEENKEQ